jgi:hypothetical protein
MYFAAFMGLESGRPLDLSLSPTAQLKSRQCIYYTTISSVYVLQLCRLVDYLVVRYTAM